MASTGRGRRVLKLLENPGSLLTTILLCNTFVNVAASSIAAGITAALLPGPLGMTVGVLAMTFLLLVIGEISPKRMARSRNRRWAEAAAPLMVILVKVFSRGSAFLRYPAEFLDRIVPGRDRDGIYREAELNILMEMAREEGFIGGEADIASAILELGERNCASAMVPREQVVFFMEDWSPERMEEEAISTGHTAYPVVNPETGRMTGVVDVRDLLGRGEFKLKDVLFFPETARLNRVLEKLRATGGGISAVVDEYGDWSGIVSVTDILERAIFAGTPSLSLPEGVSRKGDSLVIPGDLPVDVLASLLELDHFQSEYAESCGGLLQELTGKLPVEGEEIIHQKVSFKVLKTKGKAVSLILVTPGERP